MSECADQRLYITLRGPETRNLLLLEHAHLREVRLTKMLLVSDPLWRTNVYIMSRHDRRIERSMGQKRGFYFFLRKPT